MTSIDMAGISLTFTQLDQPDWLTALTVLSQQPLGEGGAYGRSKSTLMQLFNEKIQDQKAYSSDLDTPSATVIMAPIWPEWMAAAVESLAAMTADVAEVFRLFPCTWLARSAVLPILWGSASWAWPRLKKIYEDLSVIQAGLDMIQAARRSEKTMVDVWSGILFSQSGDLTHERLVPSGIDQGFEGTKGGLCRGALSMVVSIPVRHLVLLRLFLRNGGRLMADNRILIALPSQNLAQGLFDLISQVAADAGHQLLCGRIDDGGTSFRFRQL